MQAYTNTLTSRIGTYADQYRKDQFGLPELFSKGLSDINGVVSNTVSEIRVSRFCADEVGSHGITLKDFFRYRA
jgi:hypothetical protein